MKRFSQQFRKQSESIRMRTAERDQLRERILSYMEYHPLRSEVVDPSLSSNQEVILSEPFRVFTFNATYVRSLLGVFGVFLLVSIPVFAENTVPGDMLYPVKVQFNEEVRSTLAFSPYQKVAWETERMERRIAEARLLANAGKLTEEAQNKVALAVKEHSDAAQRGIEELRKDDSDEAAIAEISFASALEVQSEMLESHVEDMPIKEEGSGSSIAALVEVVAQARTDAEASSQSGSVSYEKLLGRVEAESTKVYELFSSVKESASPEEVQNMERRLNDIERKITKAIQTKEGKFINRPSMISLRAEGSSESTASTTSQASEGVSATGTESEDAQNAAISMLRATLKDIQKLINYMTHIDVRRSVSIEDLVPLTLTDEEMRTQVLTLLDETIALQNTIGLREIAAPRAEKVALGQAELESKLSDAVALLDLGFFEEALTVLEEAHEMAIDLERLTKDDPLKEVPVVPLAASSTASGATSTDENVLVQ